MTRIGIVSRTATYWPLYVMERTDFPLDLLVLGSTSAGVAALRDAAIDVAATCPDAFIAAAAPKIRIAGGLLDRPPASLVSVADIMEIAELRGRRVAVTEAHGSVSLFLRAVLRQHGLTDYEEVVYGPTPAQASALEHGEVDAAMLTFPFDDSLVARGFRRLIHVGDALGPCAFTTLNVRAGWSATAAWRDLHAALGDAVAVLADEARRPTALRVLADATGVAVAWPRTVPAYDTRVDVGGLDRLIGFMREEGIGPPGGDARAYLDSAYLAD